MNGKNYQRSVRCILPGADVSRMYALSGDAADTGLVTRASAKDVGRVCAALLSGLDSDDRRTASRIALSNTTREKLSLVPLPGMLPEDASTEQLACLWNGLMLMLLALASADRNTSVGTVIANASSMASGKPFASDPAAAERQNEVLLAKAILEAHLLDDAEANKWFEDHQLKQALARLSGSASLGGSDADSSDDAAATEYLQQLYDCAVHGKPLGGDVMSGGILADFFSDAWKDIKSGIGSALSKTGQKLTQSNSTVDKVVGGTDGSATLSDSEDENAGGELSLESAQSAVSSGVASAKDAMAQARAALESGQESLANYQEKLKKTSLQEARLQWAQAFLDAPEDVATILSAASPNLADPASFIQSMLATLPAAKATGNLGTIKALMYALKAAASKGDGSADTLYGLLTGDPATQTELETLANELPCSAMLRHQKHALARARGISAGLDSSDGSSIGSDVNEKGG